MRVLRLLLLFAAVSAALLPPSAAANGKWGIKESFKVGENVYVRAITMDEAKNSVWIGSSVGVLEVDLANRSMLHAFTRKDGLANEYVFAIGVDREGYKWFGTNAGGATRYKDGSWKTFFPMHGLADYWVYSFTTQKDGTLWIGTWAGANRVDPETGEWTTYLDELVNEWVYALAVDSKDRVWFGTEGGINMFDGENWAVWTHEDGLGAPNRDGLERSSNTGLGTRSRHDLGVLSGGRPTYNPNYVFSLIIEPDDTVWAGTWGGGVSRFDGKKWRNYTKSDGLAGNIVYSIARGKDGALWFGTNRGVTRYDGKTWTSFGVRDGLFDHDAYALAAAPDGDVWVGTKHGVSIIGEIK